MKYWLSLFLLVFIISNLYAENVDKIIKNVQKKYSKVQLLYVDFKQVNRFQLTKIENEVYGTIWIAQDNKFRLETEDQTMVSNGEKFWRYNKLENQVLIDYAKKSQQDIFLNNFLFQISDYYDSQILNEEKKGKNKIFEIKLTPKTPEENYFRYIKVWINDGSWILNKVLYVDFNDNEVEYLIEKMDLERSLTKNLFEFQSPEGSEVVDLRF
ncbi:MAG: outer membrane lipoprotein carrier protein LolA [Calditrichia bacterium]|nr:outer membrane lipoprotein carrier protein LolA [Calditrichia bacterium]